jgi:hypothetical protein
MKIFDEISNGMVFASAMRTIGRDLTILFLEMVVERRPWNQTRAQHQQLIINNDIQSAPHICWHLDFCRMSENWVATCTPAFSI